MSRELELIMKWEGGEITEEEYMELFSMLVKNGHAWTLQGTYGRNAHALIEAGCLSRSGEILKYPSEE